MNKELTAPAETELESTVPGEEEAAAAEETITSAEEQEVSAAEEPAAETEEQEAGAAEETDAAPAENAEPEKKYLKDRPTREQLERLAGEIRYRQRFRRTLATTVFSLVTVAAVAVLVAVLLLPILRIYGDSMTPTLQEGNIVISVKGGTFQTGDVIAFYYNNKILVKRVIAKAGDWVDIDDNGVVYVNNRRLDEPYITDPAFGECNIELPYQVPESRLFVMGDHRSVSIDSRNTAVGCVADEQIVGSIRFRVWPLSGFGKVGAEEEAG